MSTPIYSDKMVRPESLSVKKQKPSRKKVDHGILDDNISRKNVLRNRR